MWTNAPTTTVVALLSLLVCGFVGLCSCVRGCCGLVKAMVYGAITQVLLFILFRLLVFEVFEFFCFFNVRYSDIDRFWYITAISLFSYFYFYFLHFVFPISYFVWSLFAFRFSTFPLLFFFLNREWSSSLPVGSSSQSLALLT